MADVRALLKSELTSRRINHPHAFYNKSGNLSCRLCLEAIKADGLWEKHLRTERHQQKVKALAEETSKKRRAEEDLREESVKKLRTPVPEDTESDNEPAFEEEEATLPEPEANRGTVDEDEWAAFERDVLSEAAPTALTAAPTISAKAMTAAEIEAQEAENAAKNAVKVIEEELNFEQEDAARQLEDEFETMESLEAKVAALKERREAVRTAEGNVNTTKVSELTVQDSDDDDDEGEDNEWDGWRVRGA